MNYNVLFYQFFLLLNSKGEEWRSHRRLITPSFHDTQLLHNFVVIFNEQSCILARRLEKYTEQSNEAHNLEPYISACTLDIIVG
jgi:cytochrome P450